MARPSLARAGRNRRIHFFHGDRPDVRQTNDCLEHSHIFLVKFRDTYAPIIPYAPANLPGRRCVLPPNPTPRSAAARWLARFENASHRGAPPAFCLAEDTREPDISESC